MIITFLFAGAGLMVFSLQVFAQHARNVWRETAAQVESDFGRVENIFPKYRRTGP